jgi:hypothetical protein
MLDFGKGFIFEGSGKSPYTYLMSLNGTHADLTKPIKDEKGTEYTKAQALVLLANALDAGKFINCHMFEPKPDAKTKEVASGNTRIDIKGVSDKLSPAILTALQELATPEADELWAAGKQYLNVGRLFIDPGTIANTIFKNRFCMFKANSTFETKAGFAFDRDSSIALMMAQLWSEALYTSVWNNSGDLAGSTSVKIDEVLKTNVSELLDAIGTPIETTVVLATREYPEIEDEDEDESFAPY